MNLSVAVSFMLLSPVSMQDPPPTAVPDGLPGPEAPTLAEAAADTDAVAVIQVTDLSRTGTPGESRRITSRVMAEVLVSIQGVHSGDKLVITEDPTDAIACHLPEPGERTPRLLVFLEQRDDGTWRNVDCPESVLVTDTGQYAVRYPMDHHRAGEGVEPEELSYNDPAAWLWREDIENVVQADRLRKDFAMEDGEFGLVFTKGIVVWKLRMALRDM